MSTITPPVHVDRVKGLCQLFKKNLSISLNFNLAKTWISWLCVSKQSYVIPSVGLCKYLGILISVKNCDADLKRQMRKFYAYANMVS